MALMTELKRRNVFRVGVAYAIVAWLLVEGASVVLPTFKAPEWVMQVFTFLLILGFPVALIFAWAFELTPEGIKREAEVDRADSITHVTGRKLDLAIIGLLTLAVVYFAVDKFVLQAEPEPAIVQRSAGQPRLSFCCFVSHSSEFSSLFLGVEPTHHRCLVPDFNRGSG